MLHESKIRISSNRNFGLVFFFVFLIVALLPLLKEEPFRIWSIVIAIIFLILGLMNSIYLTPFNRIWTKFGIFLGDFIAPIVMALVFFIVVTPIGFLMRLLGKDILGLKKNNNQSYWIKKDSYKSKMKNQF